MKKKKLTEKYLIKLMREEWIKKLRPLLNESSQSIDELKVSFDVNRDGRPENVISPGLRVRKKDTALSADVSPGLVYDVEDVDVKGQTITLKRPDDQREFDLTIKQFQDEYVNKNFKNKRVPKTQKRK